MSFYQYRIIIEVFRSFGILISGPWKYKNFLQDLQVNQIYVQALLFELELKLGVNLEDEAIENCCCPQSVVNAFSKFIETKKEVQFPLKMREISYAEH